MATARVVAFTTFERLLPRMSPFVNDDVLFIIATIRTKPASISLLSSHFTLVNFQMICQALFQFKHAFAEFALIGKQIRIILVIVQVSDQDGIIVAFEVA